MKNTIMKQKGFVLAVAFLVSLSLVPSDAFARDRRDERRGQEHRNGDRGRTVTVERDRNQTNGIWIGAAVAALTLTALLAAAERDRRARYITAPEPVYVMPAAAPVRPAPVVINGVVYYPM
ncbi:MAG: hypothetical protein PHS37_10350 [Candidatus Omnitrophica bacterium]|nr:hypothetical protein [Candidatus Omnitrophota bacterium]